MLTTTRIRRTVWRTLFVLAGAAAVLAVSMMAPRYVADFGIIIVPVILVAFFAFAALFIIPVATVPAVALVIFALLPARILPQDGPLGALPLTTIVLVIWGFRRILLGPGDDRDSSPTGSEEPAPYKAAAIISGILFLAWSLITLVRSVDFQASTGWLISFTAGALLPLAVGNASREAVWIRRTWLILGGWLGAYAVVEAALRANPLWGNLYKVLGVSDAQHWSVYRAEASFGHPLFASLFFAVACALALGVWLTTNDRWTLAAGIFSGLGLVATVSRGAMLGGAVAVIVVIGAAMALRGEKRWGRFALLGVLGVIGVFGLFQFDAFTARNGSSEAALSSGARDTGIWVAGQAAELTGWLGSGPGTSGITGRLFDDVVIENSLLQLLISVGLPGLILFAGFVGAAFLHALSRRAVGEAGALLAYAICISSFNAIDALRPWHLLLGLLLILTLNPSAGIQSRTDPTPAHARIPLPTPRRQQNA